jgi:predicted transcriptional regulator
MNNTPYQEKIYRVLELVAESPRLSQREVASTTGFSLGLVNLIFKRLAQTGHIKALSLSKRKVEYILTPKGLVEKTRRTAAYVSRTVRTFLEYQRRLEQLVKELAVEDGARFAIVGDGEIVPLLEMALRSAAPGASYRSLRDGEAPRDGEIVLDCRLNGHGGSYGISVLSRLLASGTDTAWTARFRNFV